MIDDSKWFYYNNKIKETDGDQKKMFQVIEKIIRTSEEPHLPSCSSNIELVDKFTDFFITKISDIRKTWSITLRHALNLLTMTCLCIEIYVYH